MSINKVIYDNNILLDLTDSTVVPRDVGKGKVFYDASGERQIGLAQTYILEDYVDADLTGMTILYEGTDLVFDGTNATAIDTGVALFSAENINKDFRIIFKNLYIDNSKGVGNTGERCLVGAMYEVSPYPGFVIRVSTNTGAGVVGLVNKTTCPILTVSRIDGKMIFSAAGLLNGSVIAPTSNNQTVGGTLARVGNMSNCTTTHDTTVTLGCEKNASGGLYRYCSGSIEHIIIAMEDTE